MKPLLLKLLLMLSMVIIGGTGVLAQSSGPTKFPVPYGPTNTGREFWLSFPANWEYQATNKYVRLYITAGTRTKVDVWAGPNLIKSIFTVPYDVVTVDLPQLEAQVFVRDDATPLPPDQIYTKRGVHIEAEAPIVVYGINRTSATSDGLLALPVNGLGREYIVASARDISDGSQQKLPSQYMIVAPYDNTQVTIINSNQTPNHSEGEIVNITMNKGDVYSAMSVGFNGDLSGSYISASKPVAVTAGQNCTYLPDGTYPACDHLCEMMLPISSWGKFYHSVPYENRRKGDMYRVFAGEDDAKIYMNGTLYGTLARKGGTEGIGWLQILPPTRELIEFSSDKPIYVAQYNNSQTYDNSAQTDPFYLVLSPVEQYQTQLVFTTPASDFPQNYINLVCDSAALFAIEIAPGGTDKWEKLWQLKGGDYAKFVSKINGLTYVGKRFEIAPGTYRMRGPRPFAGYIYGFGFFDSYGYPLSVAVGDLTKPNDKDAPRISGTPDCFGTITGGAVTDLPFTPDDVRSNLSTVELDYNASDNYKLDVKPFEAGVYQTTTFTLTVIDKKKDAVAVIVATDMAGNESRDTIHYTAFNVTIDPNPLDLGSLIIGGKNTGTVKITNGAARAINLQGAQLQLGNRGFKLLSPTGPFTLGPAGSGTESIDAQIEFTATVSGKFQDSIGVRDSCGLRYLALVTGAVGAPIIEVTDISYGKRPLNTTLTRSFEIKNRTTDEGVLIVSGVGGPGGNPTDKVAFTLSNGLPAFPLSLKPGEAKPVAVTFKPSVEQQYLDSIVFLHNAPANPANDSIAVLSGEGIKADLVAEGDDWGRKRVQQGPYYGHRVLLTNTGTQDITISGIDRTEGDVNDFSITSTEEFGGKTLKPGEMVEIRNIWFNPTSIGDKAMQIYFATTPAQQNEVMAEVRGTGVIPGLETSDYTWPAMPVGDPEVPQTITFKIPKGEYYDTVRIDHFTITSTSSGGKNDFRMDDPRQAVTLDPSGTSEVSFTAYFQAQAPGPRTAKVTAVTVPEDNVDAVSNLSGEGIGTGTPAITGNGATISGLCVPDTSILIATVFNADTSQVDLSIQNLEITGTGLFTILDPLPGDLPVTVAPGASRQIRVQWEALTKGTETATLRVFHNDPNTPNPLELPLSGSTADIIANTHVELKAEHTLAELGKYLEARVILDSATSNGVSAFLNTKSYTVRMTYNPAEFVPRLDSIKVLNPVGATAVVNTGLSSAGLLVIDVTSPTTLDTVGTLLTVPMGVLFMPELKRAVDAEVTINDITCATVNSIGDTIDVQPVCGMNVRMIEAINGSKYALEQNTPNPFNPTTIIPYTLGLDGRTRIMLHDARGNMVQLLLDEYQQPGRYELTLDVSALPSGVYYYTVVSGVWSKTMQMTVMK